MALTEGSVLGAYRIERLIGRGGMGSVYLATDARLGRQVALKVLAPELTEAPMVRDRFLRESRAAASLDHPHILPVYEAGEADGYEYIAMRYVPGADLAGIVERDGPLPLARTIALIDQVASALDAAHAAGLIHRDVKPGNILVAAGSSPGTDHAYLSDFGLTKHAEYSADLTRSGQLLGSVGYVAPEQIEGRPIDARVDVYSLGCVLFECLAGSQPYPRDTELAILYAHVSAPPPSLAAVRPELATALDPVVATALAKDPDQRYPSAGALAAALASAAAPDAVASRTRGFLFADLRDYTAFVEANGDVAAAGLLEAYRRLVRDVVARTGGAEIRTEGDSFYVVFDSASAAVRAGLGIVDAAATATERDPEHPIRVGVGVHAGETAETAEGYVGMAVNLAARVCAEAAPGQVLVSETVRGLTRATAELTYTARGRRRLKGVTEPVALYSATATPAADGTTTVPPPRQRVRAIGRWPAGRTPVVAAALTGVAAVLAVGLAIVAFAGGRSPSSPSPSAGGPSPSVGASAVAAASAAPPSPSTVPSPAPKLPPVGRIPSGRYRTEEFGAAFGLTIELGDGWTQDDTFGDLTDYLGLRQEIEPGNELSIIVARHLSSDGCYDRQVDISSTDPQDILPRLAAIPGWTAATSGNRSPAPGANGPVIVAGPFADFVVGSGNPCDGPGQPRAVYFAPISEDAPVSPDPGGNWFFLEPGSAARLIVFDWPGAGSGLAVIRSDSAVGLRAFLPEAERVLDSIGTASRTAAGSPATSSLLDVPPPDAAMGNYATLEAGSYTTSKFQPPVTFTVGPDGWRATRDYPDGFEIDHPGSPAGYLDVGRIQVVFSDPCFAKADTMVLDQAPDALIKWLQANRSLTTSHLAPVNIAGYTGLRLDVNVAATPGPTCMPDNPAAGDRVMLFPLGDDQFSLQGDEAAQVNVLDVGGHPISIIVNGPADQLAAFADQASQVIQTFSFAP